MKKSFGVLKSVLFLGIVLVMSSFVFATSHKINTDILPVVDGVHINEIEVNPAGSDTSSEWIELYNDGLTTANLTGWYIKDKDNSTYTIPNVSLGFGEFYVLDGQTGFANSNQEIKLYDNTNSLIDDSGVISDSSPTSGNDQTWSRVPDGNGSFVLQNSTKGFTNVINVSLPPIDVVIGNRTMDPSCAFYNQAITLKADVSSSCINQVLFNVDVNGNLTNFTALKISDKYTVIIPSGTFNQAGNVNWNVIVKDCSNRIVEDSIQSITLHDTTKLIISPSTPDGLNGWYISEPTFTLENSGASNIWYRWDNAILRTYTSPFGLENIPNAINGSFQSAGMLDLKWKSDVCSPTNNESFQTKALKVDLTNPIIKDIVPSENAIIYNSLKPKISANFNEVYSGNSGINVSTALIKVDGVDVTVNATTKSKNSDGSIEYTPREDLSLGNHTVDITVNDKSGRSTERNWSFELRSQGPFEMNVSSPLDGSFNTTRILFNVTTSEIVEKMEYINYNDPNPKWKKLCVNCDSYDRPNTLKEGVNNITIRATDNINQVKEKNVMLYIDSKKPKISTTRPKSSDVTNGDFFYVKYNEDNLQKVELFWNSSVGNGSKVLENCSSGNNEACSTSIDLSAFNGQDILYWFEISDLTNKVSSKKVKVKVDTNEPIINVFMPEENESYWRNVPFNITLSEKANIEYIDNADVHPTWKTLCGNCDSYGFNSKKNKPFKAGVHNITITATDRAGNLGFEDVSFVTEL